jgi:hypothetical protein
MAEHIAKLIRERRNSVHGFLLKNHYRPSMLQHTFDYVVGNPPWLTVGSVKTPAYKALIVRLAASSEICPRNVGDQSHTELATIFLASVFEHFLRTPSSGDANNPKLGFVMPRSLYTAKHHRNLRQGLYKTQFDIVELWDLNDVKPLFGIPACVVFAAPGTPKPTKPKPGLVVSGDLPKKETPIKQATKLIRTEKVEFELAFLGKRSAWRPRDGLAPAPLRTTARRTPYAKQFRQGAILYPQGLLVGKSQK